MSEYLLAAPRGDLHSIEFKDLKPIEKGLAVRSRAYNCVKSDIRRTQDRVYVHGR